MSPARVDSAGVMFDEQRPWPDQFESSGCLPVSPRDVVKHLVQNEPLTHVAEISRCVDGYTSQLKQDSFTIVSSHPSLRVLPPFYTSLTGVAGCGNRHGETNVGLHRRTSVLVEPFYPSSTHIDSTEVLRECQGFCSAVKKRMKEAENIIDTRSQDLRRAITQLHSTVKCVQTDRHPRILFLGPVATDHAPCLFLGNHGSFHRAHDCQRCVEPVGPFPVLKGLT